MHALVAESAMNTQSTIEQMFATTHNRATIDAAALAACLEACATCAIACRACADACLGEADVNVLRRCIRKNLDCVAACTATLDIGGRLLDADPALLRAQIDLCARICASCAAECDEHDRYDHCRVCAECCRACERACHAAA
jgi:hypothetical protein